jgi:hypothetical protein
MAVLGDAPRTDHFHVLVHQPARTGGVADLDERRQFLVNVENAARHLRRQGGIARRPGDVLQRDQLHDQHAIVRGIGNREMELAPESGERGHVVAPALGIGDELAQPGVILGRGIDRGELGGKAFDGALCVHDLGDRHAGEIELHGQGFGEQAGIAPRDACAAARADLDLDDALRLERA